MALECLGRVGLWTRQLDAQPGLIAERTAAELESLGYRSLWIPEAVHREVISHATALLAATDSITVATGVARVHARSPQAAVLAQRFLAERFPDRFVFGLGVSHPLIVERVLGQTYGPPIATMNSYLDAMDTTRGGPRTGTEQVGRVLAALGPKMLTLAGERSAGAHTYVAPVEHTAWARGVLGPGPLLAPSVKVALTGDIAEGMAIARSSIVPTLAMPAYRTNVLRFGFDATDLDGNTSDRLVRALVAVGGVDAIVNRVQEHLAAGADHVCIEVLTGDDITVPIEAWRTLAPAILELG